MTNQHFHTIGFVGLGNAGGPMARELLKAGYELIVTDQDAGKVAEFVAAHGGRAAAGPDDFAQAEVVITMLPHGGVVRSALLGPGGIAEHLAPGTIVVDTSSSDPIGTRELAGELSERGIAMVDSAVSEAKVGDAKQGAATFMLGADDAETAEKVRPLLGAMSVHIFHVGPTGSGHATKTLNNYTSAAGLHAGLDAVIAAYRYGIDPMRMIDVFNVSTAANLSTEGTIKYKALTRTFQRSYSAGLLAKDMGIAAGLARATGYESNLFGLVERAFEASRDDVGFDEDMTSALLHWEHVAGLELPVYVADAAGPDFSDSQPAGPITGRVGFVGLGHAGWAMAANLAAAHGGLVVHDLDTERARGFAAEHGAEVAESAGDLGDLDILITMVPDGNAVRSILFGDENLAESLKSGTIVIDTSSSDPAGTRELAAELAQLGVVLIDSAMSVPDLEAVREGRVTFMAGSDNEQALARIAPLLTVMGSRVFHMGRVGNGHATKTLNNYVSAAGMLGLLDSLIVGHRYGLDPKVFVDVLNLSTGRNFATAETFRLYGLPRNFNAGFTLDLLVKDLRIAKEFAASVGVNTELFELVHDRYAEALEDLGPVDVSATLLHWEHRAGEQLPAAAVA